jgi:hypothetical protein
MRLFTCLSRSVERVSRSLPIEYAVGEAGARERERAPLKCGPRKGV